MLVEKHAKRKLPPMTSLFVDKDMSNCNALDLLPDDALETCFSFLGTGHYRYIAGTCRRFRHVHLYVGSRLGKHHETYWKTAGVSVSCAQLCLDDYKEQHDMSPEDVKSLLNKILAQAVVIGSLDVLKWCHVNGADCDWRVFRIAAANGHTSLLQWARSQKLDWNSPCISYDAALYGHVNVLEFIYKDNRRRQVLDNVSSFAARGGHVHALELLKKRSLLHKYNWHVWYEAARYGHVHVLDWLVENGFCPDSTVVSGGAKGGHIRVLQWAMDHGPSVNMNACAHAAFHGQLEALQWLRANNCPWDGNVLYWAHKGRHFDVVEWARINHCPTELNKVFDIDRYV